MKAFLPVGLRSLPTGQPVADCQRRRTILWAYYKGPRAHAVLGTLQQTLVQQRDRLTALIMLAV